MHVFNTWLIANLLHPVVMVVCGVLFRHWEWHDLALESLFLLFMYSLVFSLPCLLVAAGIMWLLKRAALQPEAKFAVWLFLCSTLPAACFIFIISILFKDWLSLSELDFIVPAIFSVFLTIVIRVKPFLQYIASTKQTNQQ